MRIAREHSGEHRRFAERLCHSLAERARNPVFFHDFEVPDTFDGRFEVLAFHAWLVLEWLDARKKRDLAQTFIDVLFVQFEEALREQGAGDIGMGRRVKTIAGAFYGRLKSYHAADCEAVLADALARNLFRGRSGLEPARLLARYATEARACLARLPVLQGKLDFGPLPASAKAISR